MLAAQVTEAVSQEWFFPAAAVIPVLTAMVVRGGSENNHLRSIVSIAAAVVLGVIEQQESVGDFSIPGFLTAFVTAVITQFGAYKAVFKQVNLNDITGGKGLLGQKNAHRKGPLIEAVVGPQPGGFASGGVIGDAGVGGAIQPTVQRVDSIDDPSIEAGWAYDLDEGMGST